MAQFRIDTIAELARQLAFTPSDVRLAQIDSAEELLLEIDPHRAYPLDFVVFRITGYHPKTTDQTLLTGLALQHDLGLLVERASESLSLRTDQVDQPVLGIDEVAERFNVTSKTIQRWRRRGLAARLFVFPDGKRRIGFIVSSVERFLAAHQDQVTRAANFSLVTEDEKLAFLQRARRLALHCHCCVHEIARRIGKKFNRSPLTVAHIIRKHDEEDPAQAIFPRAAEAVSDEDRAQIVRAYRRGISIRTLARRMCRPASAIYRVVIDDRVARLKTRKVRFIDDPLYHQADAAHVIDQIVAQEELAPAGERETRVPRDLPAYLQDLYRTPLLTPARERALFLKLHFRKFEFVTARRKLDEQLVRSRDLNRLESLRRRYIEIKNQIVRANLRLVVSVARKHLRPGLSLMELISDGNITIMRAVDSFDFHRGTRFSTYATLSLMKGFARSVPRMQATARLASHGDAILETLPDRADSRAAADGVARRDEVQHLLSGLQDRERDVIVRHFGLQEQTPATYEQVGSRLGLSKQRVRQIEMIALAKLKAAAEELGKALGHQ